MELEHAARMMRASPLPMKELQAALAKQKQRIRQLTSRLRTIQTDLSPPYLALGLPEALHVLCEDYNMMHTGIDFTVTFSATDVPERLHLVLYRILQEGVTNIVKHSQCTAARIVLFDAEKALRVVIEDNGIPFPKGPTAGMGLQNIEERVIVSGGTLVYTHHGSWKGLQIEWPLKGMDDETLSCI